MRKRLILPVLALAFLAVSCGDKQQEPFKDAPISEHQNEPAKVIEMPDGFSNLATVCGAPGIRVFAGYHGDDNRMSIAAVPDPNCK